MYVCVYPCPEGIYLHSQMCIYPQVLIHFADAPCHGKQYYEGHVGDDYPEGDPAHLNEWELMNTVEKLDIQYWFGYIHRDKTDKMIQVFNEALRRVSGDKMMIEQFDAHDSKTLMDLVYKSICSSISTSIDSLQGRGKASLLNYSIERRVPDFQEIEEHEATVTTATLVPGTAVYTASSDRLCSAEFSYGNPTPVMFKRGRKPFGEGAQRLAYHGLNTSTGERIVIKEFKRSDPRYRARRHYEELVQIQTLAAYYATTFNVEKPHNALSLEFITVHILEIPRDIDGNPRYFTYEPLMEGTFQKFNSNGGHVATSPLFDVIQAFSHYTWVRSRKQMVICDIQGVKNGDKFKLTDPAIHHVDFRREYGGTNLGKKGIKKFFRSHNCNPICKSMRLERLKPERGTSSRSSLTVKVV